MSTSASWDHADNYWRNDPIYVVFNFNRTVHIYKVSFPYTTMAGSISYGTTRLGVYTRLSSYSDNTTTYVNMSLDSSSVWIAFCTPSGQGTTIITAYYYY